MCIRDSYGLNEGKISHLIRKYTTLKTIEPEKNGVQVFNQLFKAYKNLGDNEELIWGNLLVTNVYRESADRVVSISDWAVSEGFLTLTVERYKDLAVDLKAVSYTHLDVYKRQGFLYSYRPDYYVFNDRNEDVYLIDGQQRFTTLFLLLFYFSLRESRYDEFIELFRFDRELEKIAFDYRVRTLTHNFIVDLISNCKVYSDLAEINRKTWFLSNYQHDVTVKGCLLYTSLSAVPKTDVPAMSTRVLVKPAQENGKDETYVIDLCDEVLGIKAIRQHRFPFLKGDGNSLLPVDALSLIHI